MAPVYKLKYFNYMGVAEPIRYLLAYGNMKYENVVMNKDDDWMTQRKALPFGNLPVLTFDDKMLFQSMAISKYLGVQLGLVPSDNLLSAEADAIANTVYDLSNRVYDWYHETNKETKAARYSDLDYQVMPMYLKDFEEWAMRNGGYFTGKVVSWVDLYFVGIMESVQGMWGQELLLQKKYPTLFQMYNTIRSMPAIKNYINTRPAYKF